jgi:hypothetical protein
VQPFYSNKAAEYWEQAASIRTVAAQISLTDVRLQLLQAAVQWETLAKEEEGRRNIKQASFATIKEAMALST